MIDRPGKARGKGVEQEQGSQKGGECGVSGRDLREMAGGWGVPEEEIGMGHEVGDALEHAPGLEDERRERHLAQLHPWPIIASYSVL